MIYGKGRKTGLGKGICCAFCLEGKEVKLSLLDLGLEIVF